MRVPLSWLNALQSEPICRTAVDQLLGEAGVVVTSVDAVGACHPRVVVGEVVGTRGADTVEVLVPTRETVTLDPQTGARPDVGSKIAIALPGALLFRHASSRAPAGPAGTVRVPPGRGPGTPTGRVCLGADLGLPDDGVVFLPAQARAGLPVAPLVDPATGDVVLTVRVPGHLPGMRSVRGLAAELAARRGLDHVRAVAVACHDEPHETRITVPGVAVVAMVCERPQEDLVVDATISRWQALAGLGGASVEERILRAVAFEQGVYLSTHANDLTMPTLVVNQATPEHHSTANRSTASHPGLTLNGLSTQGDPASARGVLLVASSTDSEDRCLDALYRATRLLGVEPVRVSRGSGPVRARRQLDLDLELLERGTGLLLAASDVRDLLARIGARVRSDGSGSVEVLVPDDRTDLHDDRALVAEIVRLAGLSTIAPTLPAPFHEEGATTRHPESRAADALRDVGFREVVTPLLRPGGSTYSPTGEDRVVRTAEGTQLRQGLAEGLVELAWGTIGHGHHDQVVRVFEVGTVVTGGSGAIEEHRLLSTVELTPGTPPPGQVDPSETVRSVITALGRAYPIVLVPEGQPAGELPDLWRIVVGEVDCGTVRCGVVGEGGTEVHNVTVVDLHLDRVLELPRRYVKAPSTPRYPVAVRDLTFAVPSRTDMHFVISTLSRIDPLIASVELVDVYSRARGETPSATVRLVFSSPWRSVPRTEVAKVLARVIESCEGHGMLLRR